MHPTTASPLGKEATCHGAAAAPDITHQKCLPPRLPSHNHPQMKLLVFAHTPPPHHGQSYMVKLLLDGLEDSPIRCCHINAQLSSSMEDIGSMRRGKLLTLLKYCLQALWCRVRHNVNTLYYIPAPGKRSALYRDWVVMLLCRPFFSRIIFHWHAVGLTDWLNQHGTPIERWITKRLLGSPDLSIALANASSKDALYLRSKHVEIVPNGIPDPCPDFDTTLLPQRMARAAARRRTEDPPLTETQRQGGLPLRGSVPPCETFRVLFMAHCTREKGLFDTLEGVRLVHEQLPGSIELTVAGAFVTPFEETEFNQKTASLGYIRYVGFASGKQKDQLLREHDCFCFPTYYAAEGQPVNLIEAMAYGLNIVTTRWRSIPELLPNNPLVPIQSPPAIAEALLASMHQEHFAQLRRHFLENYTVETHTRRLIAAVN